MLNTLFNIYGLMADFYFDHKIGTDESLEAKVSCSFLSKNKTTV